MIFVQIFHLFKDASFIIIPSVEYSIPVFYSNTVCTKTFASWFQLKINYHYSINLECVQVFIIYFT